MLRNRVRAAGRGRSSGADLASQRDRAAAIAGGAPECTRVLVIDDAPSIHDDIRKVLCPRPTESGTDLAAIEAELFGNSGPLQGAPIYQLDSAFQGQEGLAMLKQAKSTGRPYALVIVDMRMPPGWDGLETLERLWAECPTLPALVCSAYSDHTLAEIHAQLRPRSRLLLLRKPFETDELRRTVRALCAR